MARHIGAKGIVKEKPIALNWSVRWQNNHKCRDQMSDHVLDISVRSWNLTLKPWVGGGSGLEQRPFVVECQPSGVNVEDSLELFYVARGHLS